MNNFSRNKPVALVVGAASFIGSSLTRELLVKSIQVIGVDEVGRDRENLVELSKDKNFQLINNSLDAIQNLELPRLDYAVSCSSELANHFRFQQDFQSFVDVCLKYHAKIILCSSIDLYDTSSEHLPNLKYAEKFLAEKATTGKMNARVVRLAAVYGPRMDFREHDPIIKLIKSAILDRLNSEPAPLEFTTRALYINDAVRLLVKAIMHGSTAHKIYDGVSYPVKISEIKQVLMDPLWYSEKGFKPTQLPPWPTPNLNKTSKELAWFPATDMVLALKETLAYFSSHKDQIPSEGVEDKKVLNDPEEADRTVNHLPDIKTKEKIYYFPKMNLKTVKDKTILIIGLTVIFYALIFPLFRFSFEIWSVKAHLESSINLMSSGNFDEAEKESSTAMQSAEYLNGLIGKLAFAKQIDMFKNPYEGIEQVLKMVQKGTEANYHSITGAKFLASGLAVISGEKEGDIVSILNDAQTEFKDADSKIGEVSANLADSNFTSKIPSNLSYIKKDWQNKSDTYRETISLGRSLAELLPGVIALDGEKKYLIVLQDNRVLRPGGGLLKAFAEVTFSHGRLKEIKSGSIENLDRAFGDKIEPPVELKADLGETNWRMRDAAFDLDFPTSARNVIWFYNKESGTKVSGVVIMDLVSFSRLLQSVGSLKTKNSNGEITSSNLVLKIPLGRGGNDLAVEALQSLVERMLYLPKQNWVVLAKNSGQSLSNKNLLIYLTDPQMLSYLISNGWIDRGPKQEVSITGEKADFLAFSETNMSQGQDSLTIGKSVILENRIDDVGFFSHKLIVNFTATEKMTGVYNNRYKVYIPSGTKLIKATWDNKPIKGLSTFSDYGLVGYSMFLTLGVGEQTQLVIEYQDVSPVKFDNKELKYRLNLFKQPGQQSLPIDFKLTFPPQLKVNSNLQSKVGEVSVKSDLSKDRTLEILLKQ